jgi:hypothetical protein
MPTHNITQDYVDEIIRLGNQNSFYCPECRKNFKAPGFCRPIAETIYDLLSEKFINYKTYKILLAELNIVNLFEFKKYTTEELLAVKNIGRKSIAGINKGLIRFGYNPLQSYRIADIVGIRRPE